jgi:hypothetical protein
VSLISISLGSNIHYITRDEKQEKTSVSANKNVIGWSVMCPCSVIGAIGVRDRCVSSSHVSSLVK